MFLLWFRQLLCAASQGALVRLAWVTVQELQWIAFPFKGYSKNACLFKALARSADVASSAN